VTNDQLDEVIEKNGGEMPTLEKVGMTFLTNVATNWLDLKSAKAVMKGGPEVAHKIEQKMIEWGEKLSAERLGKVIGFAARYVLAGGTEMVQEFTQSYAEAFNRVWGTKKEDGSTVGLMEAMGEGSLKEATKGAMMGAGNAVHMTAMGDTARLPGKAIDAIRNRKKGIDEAVNKDYDAVDSVFDKGKVNINEMTEMLKTIKTQEGGIYAAQRIVDTIDEKEAKKDKALNNIYTTAKEILNETSDSEKERIQASARNRGKTLKDKIKDIAKDKIKQQEELMKIERQHDLAMVKDTIKDEKDEKKKADKLASIYDKLKDEDAKTYAEVQIAKVYDVDEVVNNIEKARETKNKEEENRWKNIAQIIANASDKSKKGKEKIAKTYVKVEQELENVDAMTGLSQSMYENETHRKGSDEGGLVFPGEEELDSATKAVVDALKSSNNNGESLLIDTLDDKSIEQFTQSIKDGKIGYNKELMDTMEKNKEKFKNAINAMKDVQRKNDPLGLNEKKEYKRGNGTKLIYGESGTGKTTYIQSLDKKENVIDFDDYLMDQMEKDAEKFKNTKYKKKTKDKKEETVDAKEELYKHIKRYKDYINKRNEEIIKDKSKADGYENSAYYERIGAMKAFQKLMELNGYEDGYNTFHKKYSKKKLQELLTQNNKNVFIGSSEIPYTGLFQDGDEAYFHKNEIAHEKDKKLRKLNKTTQEENWKKRIKKLNNRRREIRNEEKNKNIQIETLGKDEYIGISKKQKTNQKNNQQQSQENKNTKQFKVGDIIKIRRGNKASIGLIFGQNKDEYKIVNVISNKISAVNKNKIQDAVLFDKMKIEIKRNNSGKIFFKVSGNTKDKIYNEDGEFIKEIDKKTAQQKQANIKKQHGKNRLTEEQKMEMIKELPKKNPNKKNINDHGAII